MTGPFLVRLAFADDGTPAGHFPADVAAPQLSVLDLGSTRGDGIFETISLGNGHLQALEPHLARFAHSAAMLDLPTPDAAQWRAAIVEVAEHLVSEAGVPVDEGFVKIVMTRGVEGGSGSLLPGVDGADRVGARGGRARSHAGEAPWHPRGAPRPRLPPRHRPDGPLAAGRRQDPELRDQPRRLPRGGAARGRRRPLRQLRRLPARGGCLEPGAQARADAAHPANRPRHPGRHDPGRRLQPGRRAAASPPSTRC